MGMFDHMFSDSFSDEKEGVDFYLDKKGFRVMTEAFLAKRGYCCSNQCRHCPYVPRGQKGNTKLRPSVAKKLGMKE